MHQYFNPRNFRTERQFKYLRIKDSELPDILKQVKYKFP